MDCTKLPHGPHVANELRVWDPCFKAYV